MCVWHACLYLAMFFVVTGLHTLSTSVCVCVCVCVEIDAGFSCEKAVENNACSV